jgi:hypothetical protein
LPNRRFCLSKESKSCAISYAVTVETVDESAVARNPDYVEDSIVHIFCDPRVSFAKPPSFASWEVVVALPRYEVKISTTNLNWGLAFAEELIGNAPALDRNRVATGERCDSPSWPHLNNKA